MFIDEKGKLFGKINIIDLFVVIFVVLAVVVSVFKFSMNPSKTDKGNADYLVEYTMKITGVREFTVKQLKIGEEIYSYETSESIGRIKNIEKSEAKELVLMTDGTYKEATKPERYDVIITLETNASVNKKGFLVAGEEQLLSQGDLAICARDFRTTATILDIEKKE